MRIHITSLVFNEKPRWRLTPVPEFAIGLKKSTRSMSVQTFRTLQPYGQQKLAQMNFGPSAIFRIGYVYGNGLQ